MKVEIYTKENGRQPLADWLYDIKDHVVRSRIRNRLEKLGKGVFGDTKFLGGGVYELRFFFGPGFRVYYGKVANTVVLLLSGGDKSNQGKDIEIAKKYWQKYKEKRNESL